MSFLFDSSPWEPKQVNIKNEDRKRYAGRELKKTIQILWHEEEPGEWSEASSDKVPTTLTTSYSRRAPGHLEGWDYVSSIDTPLSSTKSVGDAEWVNQLLLFCLWLCKLNKWTRFSISVKELVLFLHKANVFLKECFSKNILELLFFKK